MAGKKQDLLFEDPKRIRGDARLLNRILTIGGCLPEDVSQALIQRCAQLAASTTKPREYAALMRCLNSYSKLVVDAERLERAESPREIHHSHAHVMVENPSLDSIKRKLLGHGPTNGERGSDSQGSDAE